MVKQFISSSLYLLINFRKIQSKLVELDYSVKMEFEVEGKRSLKKKTEDEKVHLCDSISRVQEDVVMMKKY